MAAPPARFVDADFGVDAVNLDQGLVAFAQHLETAQAGGGPLFGARDQFSDGDLLRLEVCGEYFQEVKIRLERSVRAGRDRYFALPIITVERQRLAMNLLGDLARLLVEEDCRSIAISKSAEPATVANAKRFIHAHIGMPIAPRDVIRHLVINQPYFCRVFKRTTRLTLVNISYVSVGRMCGNGSSILHYPLPRSLK